MLVVSLAKRGVRQGNRLHMLLFCIPEEVLSQGVSKVINEGRLTFDKHINGFSLVTYCRHVKVRLTVLKAGLLSIDNRVKLIKTVIHGLWIYSFVMYTFGFG